MLNVEKMKRLWKLENGKVDWVDVLTNGVIALLLYLLTTFLVAAFFAIFLLIGEADDFTLGLYVLIDVIDIGLFAFFLQLVIQRIHKKGIPAPFKTSVWAGCAMWLGRIIIFKAIGSEEVETYVMLLDGLTSIIELFLVNYLPYRLIMKGTIEQSTTKTE